MELDDFIIQYESALAAQDWGVVSPLIHKDACVTFSNGCVFRGKNAIQTAFENNFTQIQEEEYSISDIYWVKKSDVYAVCLYSYYWSGLISGEPASGSGKGTSVIIKENGIWLLLVEHLGSTT
jgi:ketosteroid isomerase-like protein